MPVHYRLAYTGIYLHYSSMAGPSKCLLVDNYDSYTFNLYHLIASELGCEPFVVYNDEVDAEAVTESVERGDIDCIVLSPGRVSDYYDCFCQLHTLKKGRKQKICKLNAK